MINTAFYDGFEGEPELILANENKKLIIWNGYFESILDALLTSDSEKAGILKEYYYHEGWYDDSPWIIPDLSLTIEQLNHFDINKVEQSDNIKNVLPVLVKSIINFLETSNGIVCIEYD
ncbi:hypothetical protein SFC66_04170 [Terribacillus saccharophilus]|uniref:hypothetical protein n=1 Tax=Terribacillus saccharophilus TaxID=361277 RepID=UPI003981A05A